VLNLLTRCSMSPRAQVRTIGSTLDGRSLDLVEFGTGPLHVWATARQHPGETQGSWWMEGFISRLLDPADGLSTKILQDATVHVVPCMNPDGCFRGHLRTNALGYNLNREWRDTDNYQAPSLERSPEVFHVLREIRATGCDMMMDIHGDETLPHNFLSGSEGVPKWQNGPRLKRLQDGFLVALMQATPDMQNTVKYPINSPNGANLSVGSKYIAETFDCLSFTIEMPFKDTADHPHPVQGWCPERAMNFGAAFVNAVAAMLPHLRDK